MVQSRGEFNSTPTEIKIIQLSSFSLFLSIYLCMLFIIYVIHIMYLYSCIPFSLYLSYVNLISIFNSFFSLYLNKFLGVILFKLRKYFKAFICCNLWVVRQSIFAKCMWPKQLFEVLFGLGNRCRNHMANIFKILRRRKKDW